MAGGRVIAPLRATAAGSSTNGRIYVRRHSLLSRSAAAAGVLALAFAASAGTAQAAESRGGVATFAAAPTCVKVNVDEGTISKTAYVKNGCSTTKRVKVVWSFAPDSGCNTLKPGQGFKSKRGLAPQFDGLALC